MNKLASKKMCFALIAFMGASLSMVAQATEVNLALKAIKVNASVNSDEVSLIADNARVKYWSTEGADFSQYQYVEFEWSATSKVVEADVYWAKPNATKGTALPTDAYLAYWNGEDWVKDASLNTVNESYGSSVTTELQAKKVRIYMLRRFR